MLCAENCSDSLTHCIHVCPLRSPVTQPRSEVWNLRTRQPSPPFGLASHQCFLRGRRAGPGTAALLDSQGSLCHFGVSVTYGFSSSCSRCAENSSWRKLPPLLKWSPDQGLPSPPQVLRLLSASSPLRFSPQTTFMVLFRAGVHAQLLLYASFHRTPHETTEAFLCYLFS